MRGDGRTFKRGDTWWVAFYVDGREQRESAKTRDEGIANKYLRRKLKEVHAHELDPGKSFLSQRDRKRTISELMDALKVDFEIRGKWNPQVRTNVEHVRTAFGSTRATALIAEQVDEYIQVRLSDGSAKASINRVTQLLKQAYGLAELPVPRIRRLDESDNVRRGFFTEIEVRRVMANLPSELADFTLFAWLTGMRKGEIASLRWEDFDGDCTHNKPFVDEPGIIVGRKGNVGAVYFSAAPFWPIDTTYYIDNENVSRFLFYALQRLQFINTDVAVPGLNRDFAHSRELIVPADPILNRYEEKVAPLFSMAKLLERQNTQLQAGRDLLLPRLMSGEVEV